MLVFLFIFLSSYSFAGDLRGGDSATYKLRDSALRVWSDVPSLTQVLWELKSRDTPLWPLGRKVLKRRVKNLVDDLEGASLLQLCRIWDFTLGCEELGVDLKLSSLGIVPTDCEMNETADRRIWRKLVFKIYHSPGAEFQEATPWLEGKGVVFGKDQWGKGLLYDRYLEAKIVRPADRVPEVRSASGVIFPSYETKAVAPTAAELSILKAAREMKVSATPETASLQWLEHFEEWVKKDRSTYVGSLELFKSLQVQIMIQLLAENNRFYSSDLSLTEDGVSLWKKLTVIFDEKDLPQSARTPAIGNLLRMFHEDLMTKAIAYSEGAVHPITRMALDYKLGYLLERLPSACLAGLGSIWDFAMACQALGLGGKVYSRKVSSDAYWAVQETVDQRIGAAIRMRLLTAPISEFFAAASWFRGEGAFFDRSELFEAYQDAEKARKPEIESLDTEAVNILNESIARGRSIDVSLAPMRFIEDFGQILGQTLSQNFGAAPNLACGTAARTEADSHSPSPQPPVR